MDQGQNLSTGSTDYQTMTLTHESGILVNILLNSKDKCQDFDLLCLSYMEAHTCFLYMVNTWANREWILPKAS